MSVHTINYSDEMISRIRSLFLPQKIIDIVNADVERFETKTIMSEYHRYAVLKQGRADFDIDDDVLAGKDKVDLYGYYYFQMHATSQYVFFLKAGDPFIKLIKNKRIHFLDVGCGPGTAGIAFASVIKKQGIWNSDIHYYGVDLSINMINKAQEVIGTIKNSPYKSQFYGQDINELYGIILDNSNVDEDQIVIINFAFLFASETLDVDLFAHFTNEILSMREKVNLRVLVFFQNPNYAHLNNKWKEFKNKVEGLTVVKGYPKVIRYAYDDCLGSSTRKTLTLDALSEILKN